MALTITETLRASLGGKAWRYIDITDDATTSTFTAASAQLTWCEYVANLGINLQPGVPNTSVLTQYYIATTNGLQIEMGVPSPANSIKSYLLIGW